MSKRTVKENIMRRRSHRQFVRDITGLNPVSPHHKTSMPRKIVRAFCMWVASQLMQGNKVELFGVGTITATFRKGRTIQARVIPPTSLRSRSVSIPTTNQPGRWVLKIKASPKVREALIQLGKDESVPRFGSRLSPAEIMAHQQKVNRNNKSSRPNATARSEVPSDS